MELLALGHTCGVLLTPELKLQVLVLSVHACSLIILNGHTLCLALSGTIISVLLDTINILGLTMSYYPTILCGMVKDAQVATPAVSSTSLHGSIELLIL